MSVLLHSLSSPRLHCELLRAGPCGCVLSFTLRVQQKGCREGGAWRLFMEDRRALSQGLPNSTNSRQRRLAPLLRVLHSCPVQVSNSHLQAFRANVACRPCLSYSLYNYCLLKYDPLACVTTWPCDCSSFVWQAR